MKRLGFLSLSGALGFFALAAGARAGEIEVRGGAGFSTLISSGDTTPRSADGTDFGTLTVGSGTRANTFRINNVGTTALTVFFVTDDGAAFSISGASGPTNPIAAGGHNDFTITFDPTSAGVKTATVAISNSDSNEGTYTFSITGEALGEPEIVVRGRLTPVSNWVGISDGETTPNTLKGQSYATQQVEGGSESHTFQIENTGTAQLQIDSITDDSPHFSVTGVPNVIGVNQTQTFNVVFNPNASGTHMAVITIQNNDANEDPFTFTVVGVGEAPDLLVAGGEPPNIVITNGDTTPRELDGTDFGPLDAGTVNISPFLEHVFRLRNDGNSPLTIFAIIDDGAAFSISGVPGPTSPIAPGGQNDFTIRFDPDSLGVKTATVTITSNDPEDVYTFTVRGEGTGEPEIEVRGQATPVSNWIDISDGETTPDGLKGQIFAALDVDGGSESHSFKILDTGSAPLQIDSITDDSPHFSITGDTQSFNVVFNPTTEGTHTAVITIQNNDANEDPFTFTVIGVGEAPDIEVYGGSQLNQFVSSGNAPPTEAKGTDFGPLPVGSAVEHVFRIRNTGNVALMVSAVSEDGAAFSLSGVPGPTSPIPAGGHNDFTLRFEPVSAGTKNATVIISSNDPDESPYSFLVTGEALGEPEIVVSGQATPVSGWVSLTDGETSPNALKGQVFASQPVGGNGETHTFRLQNTGTAQLQIASITDDSPHFSVGGVPSVVGVNQTQTFTVTFNPSATGTHTAVITIQNNDANEDPFTFRVTGGATGPEMSVRGGAALNRAIPDGDTSPTAADGTDFGAVLANAGQKQTTFTIFNNGNDPLILSGAGSSDAQFTLSGVPGITTPIPPGGSNDFTITYAPTSTGLDSSTITLLSNDPATSPYTFAVSGEGGTGEPELLVHGQNNALIQSGDTIPETADGTYFGVHPPSGTPVARDFTLRNSGTGDLFITSVTVSNAAFSIDAVPSAPIAPGDSARLTLTFTPPAQDGANFVGNVRIISNIGTPYTFDIRAVTEAAAPPEANLAVRGGSPLPIFPIANGSTQPFILNGTHFGEVLLGSTHRLSLQLRNNGSGVLSHFSSATDLNEARLMGSTGQVAPGNWRLIVVEFEAVAVGPAGWTVSITTDDPDTPVYTFSMAATVVTEPSEGPQVTAVETIGTTLEITVTTTPGKICTLYVSSDCVTWSRFPGMPDFPGAAQPVTLILTNEIVPGQSRRFYRLEEN